MALTTSSPVPALCQKVESQGCQKASNRAVLATVPSLLHLTISDLARSWRVACDGSEPAQKPRQALASILFVPLCGSSGVVRSGDVVRRSRWCVQWHLPGSHQRSYSEGIHLCRALRW